MDCDAAATLGTSLFSCLQSTCGNGMISPVFVCYTFQFSRSVLCSTVCLVFVQMGQELLSDTKNIEDFLGIAAGYGGADMWAAAIEVSAQRCKELLLDWVHVSTGSYLDFGRRYYLLRCRCCLRVSLRTVGSALVYWISSWFYPKAARKTNDMQCCSAP